MIGFAAESFAEDIASCVREVVLARSTVSAVQRLNRPGIETARLDAEVLLGHVLALTREQIWSSPDRLLDRAQLERYQELLQLRLARAPVAYITGRQEFWSLDFQVTPGVLVPRADTERLVEIAFMLKSSLSATGPLRMLDIGTGSGAVAVSLAGVASRNVVATDDSQDALEIARKNAVLIEVADRIRFIRAI